jgi:hypothetical protein
MKEVAQMRRPNPWRLIGWGAAVVLLAAPFAAMQFHAEGVDWSPGDFVFAGLLFALVGGLLELAVRKIRSGWYRAAVAVALLGNLLVIWSNLAVGIVGSENNPANQLFFAALLVGIGGAFIARFRAGGMAVSMGATAVSLLVALLVASLGGTDEPKANHSVEVIATGLFAALFLISAGLFRRSAQSSSSS